MAIQPKGKKVTGTKGKDKIAWQSTKPWATDLTVKAGAGNDVINFAKSKYKNKLYGESGNDTIYGGTSNDYIYGGAGNDLIKGTKGKNTLVGGAGNDKIYGGSGNDLIKGTSGKNYLKGGAGNDTIYGGTGNDTIVGTSGKNKLYGGKGNDSIVGGTGNDTIYGQYGNNILKGGAGNDSIYAGTGTDKIWGGAGNDLIDLTKGGKNTVYGEAGNDKIINIKGNAVVDGGADNDTIIAISGSNTLKGGAGNDSITGGSGNDSIEGGAGDDIIAGGKGNDIINAGTGNNTIKFALGDGKDTIISGGGVDTVDLGSENVLYDLEKEGNDLEMRYYKHGDYSVIESIILKDYFASDSHSVKYLQDKYYQGESKVDIESYSVNVYGEGTIEDTKYYDNIYGTDGVDVITAGRTPYDSYYDYIDPYLGNDIVNIVDNGRVYIDILNEYGNDTINNASNADFLTIYHERNSDIYGYQDGSDYKIVRQYTVNDEQHTAVTTLTNFNLSEHPDVVIINQNGNQSSLSAYNLEGFNPETSELKIVSGEYTDTSNTDLYILASNGADSISTGTGNDVISAGNGDNSITSSGGNNRITAGTGDDTITVNGTGNNYIEVTGSRSNSGNEITVNSTGENTIKGGSGVDQIEVNGGTNYIYANGGRDTITLNGGENYVEFNGNNYNSRVDVYGGDVTVKGGSQYSLDYGNIYLDGGDNAINMTGSENSEYVHINSGVNNHLDLGAGNDMVTIQNAQSSSVIVTGTGEDTISIEESVGTGTTVTIYGGADSITGEDTSHNYYNMATGSAEIHTGSMGDRISVYGENATAVVYGNDNFEENQGDSINGIGSAGITVYGGDGMNTITGSYHDDSIVGGDLSDTISGNGGNDTINAGGGDDYIHSGNDTLAGNLEITGGTGNDIIYLNNTHKETLIFNNGDGNDTIYSSNTTSDSVKKDELVFNTTLDNIVLRTDPNNSSNIIIKYNNGQDSVVLYNVKNYSSSNVNTSITKIITTDYPSGISFDEFLATRSVYNLTDTNEFTPDSETNGVSFVGSIFNDYITGTDNNDTIWAGWYNSEGGGNDTIYGGAGNDSIRMTFGNNTIYGGKGNDTISMDHVTDEEGTNTAIFTTGDDMDYVKDFGERAILKFEGVNLDDINISSTYEVYDAYGNGHSRTLITYNNSGTDGVILDDNSLDASDKLVNIEADDGVKTLAALLEERHIYLAQGEYQRHLIADTENYAGTATDVTTENADRIYVSGLMNTIEGGKGNDTIESIGVLNENNLITNVGYNKYIINVDELGEGDGTDTIINDNSRGYNSILIKGVGANAEDTAAQKAFLNNMNCYFTGDEVNGYDLNIEYATNGKLIFKNIDKNDLTGLSTGEIGFVYKNNEGKYDYDNSNYSYMNSYNLTEYLNIPIQMTAGTPYAASENYTEIITGTSGDDTVTLNGYNKTVDLKAGNDTIIIRSDENSGNYTIMLGSDNKPDYIWFKDITDTSKLYASRDYLYDENGNPIHDEHYNYSYSNDLVISEIDNYNAKVIIKDYFTHALVDNEPTFMTIKYGETGTDTISLKDFIDTIIVDNRTDKEYLVNGTCFDDLIKPAAETNELIYAGKGNDTIEYNAYDSSTQTYKNPGADIVYGGEGDDSITYRDYHESSVKIYGGAGNDTINITSGTAYGGAGSDEIHSSGCNVYSHVEENSYHEHEVALYGFSAAYEDAEDDGTGNDTIYGSDKNDTIFGSKGNDSIEANSGHDLIKAGSGNDYVAAGGGNDTIYGGNGNDTIFTCYTSSYYADYTDYTGYSTDGRNKVYGEAGDDTIILQGNYSTVSGGVGDDLIVSSSRCQNEFHFNAGDGDDTIYTSRRGYVSEDTFVFDDIIFDGTNITANFTESNNTLTITYNNGSDHIYVKDYMEKLHHYDNETGEPIDEYYNYTYPSNINSSLDKLIDMNGNTLSIRDMILVEHGTTDEYMGTFFSDTATMSAEINSYYAGYGNDTITGNDSNSYLYGYDSSYSGWGVEGDGNDKLDGKQGYNRLYGGWGDDTLIGGWDAKTDTMWGGLGANTYQMKNYTTKATVAEIHISSDKDTISIPTPISWNSYMKDGDNLMLDYRRSATYYNNINIYNWYNNPRDIIITGTDETTYLYDDLKEQVVDYEDDTLGIEFGPANTSSSKIYLGTSGNDSMDVRYGTTVSGGYGNDSIMGDYCSGSATIYGGEGNDTIRGTGYDDLICGGDGRDSLYGGEGNDTIYTSSYSEYYYSFNMETESSYKDAVEQLVAPNGNSANWDTIDGGAGNDVIFAVGENALLMGDEGNDTYHLTLDNVARINDFLGDNNIILHSLSDSWGENAYIGIDATNYQALGDFGVLIMNYDAYNYWIENQGDMSEYKGGYVSLASFGSSSHSYLHATITDSYGRTISSSALDALKIEVTSWLTENGMTDIRQEGALYQGSELAQIFNTFNYNNWESQ